MDKKAIRDYLKKENHVPISQKSYSVTTPSGEKLGNVSYSTMNQLRQGRNVSSITPKNDEEKSVLEKYQKYVAEQTKKRRETQKVDTSPYKAILDQVKAIRENPGEDGRTRAFALAEQTNQLFGAKEGVLFDGIAYLQPSEGAPLDSILTPIENEVGRVLENIEAIDAYNQKVDEVSARYGINPDTFSQKDLEKWALGHNYEYRMVGNDLTGATIELVPKQAGGLNLWKTLATEQEKADFEVLQTLANSNADRKFAKNHPIFASFETVIKTPSRSLGGAISTVKDAVDVARGQEINLFSPMRQLAHSANTVKETVTDTYAKNWFGGAELPIIGNVGTFLYNTGMSMGENAVNMAVGTLMGNALGAAGASAATVNKAISGITSGLMASDVTANAIIANKRKGLSDASALGQGIASGLIELATERYSIEKIINSPAKTLKGTLARSAMFEGSEEMTSEVLNTAVDIIVNQKDSELQKSINSYMKDGDSEGKAVAKAWGNVLSNVISAGISGAVSGVGMGGAHQVINTTSGKNKSNDTNDQTQRNQGLSADAIKEEPLAWNPEDETTVNPINAAGSYDNNLSENKGIVNPDIRENTENDTQADTSSVAYGDTFSSRRRLDGDGSGTQEQNNLAQSLAGARGRGVSVQQAEADIAAINNKAVSSIAGTVQMDAEAVDGGAVSRANTAFLSRADALVDADFVKAYADSFVAGLATKNSSGYQHLSSLSENVAEDIMNYAVKGILPEGYGKQAAYAIETFAGDFSRVVQDMASSAYAAKTKFYTEVPYMSRQISALREGNLKEVMDIADYQKNGNAAYERFKAGNTVTLGDGIIAVADPGGNGYFVFGENAAKLAELTGMEATTMLFGEDAVPMLVLSSRDAEKLFGDDIKEDSGQVLRNYSQAVEDIETVDDETAKKYAENRMVVQVTAQTPDVILEHVSDAQNLPVIMNYNKLYLAVRSDGVFKGHYHNLGAETAKKLPEFLTNPDAIVRLNNGRLNMFTTVKNERGNNGIISVELNSTKDIAGKYEKYNVVVTMFSSDDQYVKNLVSQEGVSLKYKTKDLPQVNPQLYKWLAIINDKSSIDTSISQNDNGVNNNVSRTAAGYALTGMPSEAELEMVAKDVVENQAIVELSDENMESVVLMYDEDVVNEELVKKDITGYYQEGIIPENANVGSMPWDDMQLSATEKRNELRKKYLQSTDPQIERAVQNIIDGKVELVPKILEVAELTPKTVEQLRDFLHIDLTGYKCCIERDSLEHIINRHGKNGKQDTSMSNPKDIARMGFVVNHFDNIDWVRNEKGEVVHSKKYNNSNNTNVPVFAMEFRINGKYYLSEVAPETKKKTIWITSARINKKDGSQVPDAVKTTPYQTPEAPLDSPSNTRISQNDSSVNSKDMQSAEENAKSSKKRSLSAMPSGTNPLSHTSETLSGTASSNTNISQNDDGVKNSIRTNSNHDTDGGIRNERNDILPGNLGREIGESAGEQGGNLQEVTGRSQTESGIGESNSRSRRVYAETVRTSGQTQERRIRQVRAEFIKEEGYTPEMQQIAEENAARGIKATHFFLGRAGVIVRGSDGHLTVDRSVDFRGAYADSVVYLRCDDANFSPSQINRHELVHDAWDTPEMQAIEKQIAKSLTDEDMNYIKNVLYSHYAEIVNGDETAIFQEFVADTLAGMNEYSARFADIADTYWSQAKSDVDIYSPATYTESIDAGGNESTEKAMNQSEDEVALSISNAAGKSFAEQVKETLEGSTDRNHVYVGQTTSFLKQIGLNPDLPMLITRGHLRDMNHAKVPGETKYHGLSEETIANKLPYILDYPAIVFDSFSGSNKDAVCLLSEVTDEDGLPLLVVIKPDGSGRYNDVSIDSNFILTMYGKDNPQGFLRAIATNKDNVIYMDKKRTQDLLKAARLYLPAELSKLRFNTILHQSKNVVKNNISKISEKDTDIRFSASSDTDAESLDSLADSTYDYLSDPISSIQDDMKDVQMRAELREGKVYEPQDARQICASILDNLDVGTGRGISMTRQNKYRAQILIYRALNAKDAEAQAEGWRKVGAFVAQNAVVQDAQEYFDYSGALQQVRDITRHSFNLTDADKRILDDTLGESAKGYKALFGGGTRSADEVYAELSDARPDLFPSDVTTDGDQLAKIAEVYQWLKEGGEQKSLRLLSVLDSFEDKQAFDRLIQTQIQEAAETQGRPSRMSAERIKYEQRYQADMERMKNRYEKQIAKLKEETQGQAKEWLAKKNIKPQPYVRPEGLTVASRKYGRIAPGENPVREVEVPRKVSDDRYVSRFARTMMEAGVTPDSAISEFEERILDGTMTYERITDKDAKKWADNFLREKGFANAVAYWDNLIDSNARLDKNHMALGMQLYNQCVNAKDAKTAMKIAADLARIATYSGQNVQALRLLKQMSPDAQLYNLEKCVERINSDLEKQLKKKYKEIRIDEKLAEEYLTAKTEADREAALEQLEWQIAEQIPSTVRDKLASWRYFAMLANPRTHVRNLAGNAIFVPAVEMKNFIGAALEKTLPKGQRTKGVVRAKGTVKYADADFKKMLPALSQNSGGKYSEVMAGIEGKRTIFQSKVMKPLEKARRGNFKLLELEDDLFKRRAYVSAFSGMMTARGYTAEFLSSGTLEANQALDDLRAYAWSEALKATYQDENALANWISKAQKELKNSESVGKQSAGLLLEGVLPFKRTPLNIVKRAMEYSPYGAVKGAVEVFNGIRTGEWTPAQALDDLAKGMSGTMIMGMGALLAYFGIIDGVGDEDDKVQSWEEAQGYQEYALRIGDYTYTIDWAAPASLPLFIGVEIMKMIDTDGLKLADVLNVMSRITEPMMELSVLQGVSSAIKTAGYSKQDPISAIATDVTLSYFGQYVPTLLGQFARTIDPTRRTTYNDKNSNLPKVLDSFIQRMEAKIPFASFALQPRLDVWGREENYGDTVAERIFGNFISPGYLNDVDSTRVDKELARLYAKTGDNGIFPTKPSKYFSEGGTRYDLTGTQYTKYSKIAGQDALEKIDNLIKTSSYKNATDAEKAEAIAEILANAKDKAKDAILRDMDQKAWFSGASDSASETLAGVQEDEAYHKTVVSLSPTGKASLEYEKSAMIASYVESASEIINALPKKEQKAAGTELVATVKKLQAELAVDEELAAELGTKELEKVFGQSAMPEPDISYTKNKVKHEYTLTPAQYNEYAAEVVEAIQDGRARVRRSNVYRNASAEQRIELLKESDSAAKSEVKQLYQRKYAGKK